MNNLKQCPFCGGVVTEGKMLGDYTYAQCTECDAEWGHTHAENTITQRYEIYNRRVN